MSSSTSGCYGQRVGVEVGAVSGVLMQRMNVVVGVKLTMHQGLEVVVVLAFLSRQRSAC